jgi:hypothetical protein
MPPFGAMLPDRTVWELVAYIQSISEKPTAKFGKTTSLQPQSPSHEQIPAERMQTATPWQFTEPMPPTAQSLVPVQAEAHGPTISTEPTLALSMIAINEI